MAKSRSKSRLRSGVLRRSFHKEFPAALRGEGVYLWDCNGNRYLDFSGSAAVNLIGHGVPEVAAAVSEQIAKLEFAHTSQFTTPVAEDYACDLLEFAGEKFRGGSVYFTSGGSEAVETALKLARQYQVEVGKKKRYRILSRHQSYHGSTLGALAVSGNRRRREMYLPMVREFAHVGIPHCYRCSYDCTDGCRNCGVRYARELERAIKASKGEVAAFIFEPVSGATLGAVIPPPGYLSEIQRICHAHGVLLIADEVMTGMGRTGHRFAIEHWDISPDILVAAKGLSSGYAPLGAVIISKQIGDAINRGSGAFVHGFTYNAHPVSLAAGTSVLRYLQSHDLVHEASSEVEGTAGANLSHGLQRLWDCNSVGDVRGIGLLWAVEFVASRKSKKPFAAKRNFAGSVAVNASKRGLLVYPMQGSFDGISGDHLLIAPPAVITEEEIGWAVEQLRLAIHESERTI